MEGMRAHLEAQALQAEQRREDARLQMEAMQQEWERKDAERQQMFDLLMQRMKDETTLQVAQIGQQTTLKSAQISAANTAAGDTPNA
jgi:hypothetical protein